MTPPALGALALSGLAIVAGCGAPVATPEEPAAPPAATATATATTTASAAASAPPEPPPTASASASPDADLPKARDPRGVSKRADGACFEFATRPCPPGQTCKPPQPRRVRCPD